MENKLKKKHCPYCGSEYVTETYDENNIITCICENCHNYFKVFISETSCSTCRNKIFAYYIKKTTKYVYCCSCGRLQDNINLIKGYFVNTEDMIQERLNFKTSIPKDYLLDLSLDMYEFEKGKTK